MTSFIGTSVLAVILIAYTSSCSLVREDASSVTLLWSSQKGGAGIPDIASVGATDAEAFYAERGRFPEPRFLTSYDRRDGSVRWSVTRAAVCSPPIVQPGRIYCAGDVLVAHNSETGAQVWTYTHSSTLQLVHGTADDARVYVGVDGAPTGAGRALAVDAATGTLVWDRAFDGPGWKGNGMRSLTLSPEGDLLVAFKAEYDSPPSIFSATVIAAVDPATGEERWRFVDGDATTTHDIGELTLWNDLVLYSDATGQEAVAFDRRTRRVVWRAPFTPGSFSTLRPPYVADGVAYFTDTLGGVFAVDAATGAEVWSVERPFGFLSHAVCGDIVFGTGQIGSVLDRRTGRYLGELFDDDQAASLGQVATADGVLYVSASTGVYAFDCSL